MSTEPEQPYQVRFQPAARRAIAQRLPETRKLETPYGQFQLEAESDGSHVKVTTHLVVSKHRVSKGDYAGFRRFLLDVDAALNQEIVAGP